MNSEVPPDNQIVTDVVPLAIAFQGTAHNLNVLLISEQEAKTAPVAWLMSAQDRREHLRRIQEWLETPAAYQGVASLLLHLIEDDLVVDAYRQFVRLQRATAGQKTEVFTDTQDNEQADAATASTFLFYRYLNTLQRSQPDFVYDRLQTAIQWCRQSRAYPSTLKKSPLFEGQSVAAEDRSDAAFSANAADAQSQKKLWQEPTVQEGSVSKKFVPDLINYCADQMAAALLFKNCSRLLEAQENFWNIIVERVIRKVLLGVSMTARAQHKQMPSNSFPPHLQEDMIRACVAAILEVSPNFEYRGMRYSIQYFRTACFLAQKPFWDQIKEGSIKADVRLVSPNVRHNPEASFFQSFPQTDTDAVWHAPDLSDLLRVYGRNSALGFWILRQLREQAIAWVDIPATLLQERLGIPADIDPPRECQWPELEAVGQRLLKLSCEETSLPDVLSDLYRHWGRPLNRSTRLFVELLVLFENRAQALKFWVISILKEDRLSREEKERSDYGRIWDEISIHIQQPGCGLLSEDDLPWGVEWEEIEIAFTQMKITPSSLLMFYTRAKKRVVKSFEKRHLVL